MIAHLSGTLLSKEPNQVIVDVGGVGYDVTIPLSTFYDLDDQKSDVQLLIYTHVKEDALQLYGFKTASERKLFVHFISVSGVGPKLGIALLSHMKAEELIESIKSNNLARLTQIPGIGRKTAERLVVDLRDKMIQLSQEQVAVDAGTKSEATYVSSEDTVRGDALSALFNLGYQRSAAEKAIDAALNEGGEITVESILRRSLKKLARV
ncbi:MAG TPA: Holliday junction branch migration protein RuvA [Pyrinomonadaceae bacterium]|jgi:Holliday junction DNA helicase RuvA|nr:Holliday junction branch migration protein RuvA [Pyrinomonadaceae bacterium]